MGLRFMTSPTTTKGSAFTAYTITKKDITACIALNAIAGMSFLGMLLYAMSMKFLFIKSKITIKCTPDLSVRNCSSFIRGTAANTNFVTSPKHANPI